ncbi:MAG: hypothetical protein A3F18_03460 [Legionellales bacterium RIFCSPHIGHO2_12_FULL_37_14]|nr:MAG: hypothetical protein A3F18_03460 [Legionellales bacterium RIFCSPHIGHO2_12_FULL_37_14]
MNEYFQMPPNLPHYACIWLHGLGASGQDMRAIAEAMPRKNNMFMRHIFLDAPKRPVSVNQGIVMPAWYDIFGMQITAKEDKEGLINSAKQIHALINTLNKQGFSSDKIYLAGFSQGAAMVFYAGLTYENPLAGVIALSGYLPLARDICLKQPVELPIFVGYGRYDSVVMPAWTQESVRLLKEKQYTNITVEDFPIDHGVCPEEINSCAAWLQR